MIIPKVAKYCRLYIPLSFGISFFSNRVPDFIFSVSRTTEDKQTNGGRIYIAKNRNGVDGLVFSIFMDTANVDIKVLGRYEGDAAQSPALTNEEQVKSMLDKYKKLIKGAN